MEGKLYIVGVGPGDPELLTLKALKVIKDADIIACPEGKNSSTGIAYKIVQQAVPEIVQKEYIFLNFPMIKKDLSVEHHMAAEQIQKKLQDGKSIVFLTLGDVSFYSTAYYMLNLINKDEYVVEIVSGITSFSVVSARLQIPLALGDESVLISPSEFRDFSGTQVILKVGSRLNELKDKIKSTGKDAFLIENCGMENEKVYCGIDSLPEKVGYLSILIIK